MRLKRHLLLALRFLRDVPADTRATLLFWAAAALVGVVAVVLAQLSTLAFSGFAALAERYPWWPFISLPLGGMAIRWIMLRFGRGAEGSGIPQAVAALSVSGRPEIVSRLLSLRIAAAKFVGIVMGMGCGFVLGREGPTVQIGASIMHACHRWLPGSRFITPRQLILAGGAAGIAAAFNTPLAGIIFAFEELARSVEEKTSGKLLGAVIIAGVVSIALLGDYTYFGEIKAPGFDISILLPLVPIAVSCGLIGGLFARLCVHQPHWLPKRFFVWRQRHPYFFIAACGIVIALCGLIAPIHGSGAEATSEAVTSGTGLPWYFLPLKFIGMLCTFLTGIPGGIFAPSLSLGAGVGSWFLPLVEPALHPKLIAIGMSAMLAAVTRAPLTAATIMMEMTNGHEMVISTLTAAMIGSAVARTFRTRIYHDLGEYLLHGMTHLPTPNVKDEKQSP